MISTPAPARRRARRNRGEARSAAAAPSPSSRPARHIVDRHPAALLAVDQPLEQRPWLEGLAALAGLLLAIALLAVVRSAGPDLPDLVRPRDPAPVAEVVTGGGSGAAPTMGRVGVPIRDGDVEFTVSPAQVGTGPDGGTVAIVAVLVRNLGPGPVSLTASRQSLTDETGRSTPAQDGLVPGSDTSSPVDPGPSRTMGFGFVLNTAAVPQSISLDSGTGAGGVAVSLAS